MFKRYALSLTHQSKAFFRLSYYSTLPSTKSRDETTTYSILNPFIDFEERIQNDKLQESLTQRKLDLNLKYVSGLWKEYKRIESDKMKLEESRNEIKEKIKSFSNPEKHSKEIAGLKLTGKTLRQDIKNISNVISDIEQILLHQIITLPNDLRNDLYPDEVSYFLKPQSKPFCHLEIGKRLNLVDFISPAGYFLKSDAADFELEISEYFSKLFYDKHFIPFSNPDFSRSLIVEGACIDQEFLIKLEKEKRNDDLFLNGGASLYPFCSFHTKMISNKIPVRYVSEGRHYAPFSQQAGLFSVLQSNAVQVFIASSENDIIQEFQDTLKTMIDAYIKLNIPFRILRLPPENLHLSEGIRLSFQVHSPFRNSYHEVGNLSFYSDYLSKRLRMYYSNKNDTLFLHVVSGTVMKVPPLLASTLEYTESCEIPLKKKSNA